MMINLAYTFLLIMGTYKGYRAGLLKVLFGLVGFLVAYILCFLSAQALAELFRSFNIGSLSAFVLSVALLFSGSSLFFTLLSRLVLAKVAPEKSRSQSIGGAILGAVLAALMGLVIIWCYSLAKVSLSLEFPSSPLEKKASYLVGSAAELGLNAAGLHGVQAAAAKVMFKRPEVFVHSLKTLSQSEELRTFVNDPRAQFLMASGDVGGLLQADSFNALVRQEGVNTLLSEMDRESDEPVEQVFAKEITQVWQRMQVLKHDPEVQAILQDEEVKDLIRENNPVALLANDKIQLIINRVMNSDFHGDDLSAYRNQALKELNLTDRTLTETVDKSVEGQSVKQLKKDSRVFRWQDDKGRAQYGDYKSIPVNKRESARLISE